ncbi:LLM class flavin-dependent oxidoreductase [Idiomarina sp.]|uniref:LLM class flavin-dependent oxidoreductase n=1 Tax=Idiomarina sp. TaxID=1874361 RepID=UPI00262839F2|nr:LLM class flavin-dependent oxidoreductase [Idiomarina sp.]
MKYSLLDLAPVTEEGTAATALHNAADIAQHAEKWGYSRFWMAEHHNMEGIASAATAVALGYVASKTEHIRVGSAGIMLPNHAPFVVAEQFGTLDALYPGRVDLGLGRAPGTDGATLRALRRSPNDAENFPRDVQELLGYLAEAQPADVIKAVPGYGQKIPVWLLGSSTFGAQLAAHLGLPYAFASHFAPDYLHHALKAYRDNFKPSQYLDKPYVAAAMNVFAAESETEARYMMSSMQQQFIALRRGTPGKLKAPVEDISRVGSPQEIAGANHALTYTAVGTKDTVSRHINQFIDDTGIDELILTCHGYDHNARLRSFEIASEVLNER